MHLSFRVVLVGSDSVSYEDCLADPDVISEAFCLPKGYRKDVPPSSESGLWLMSKDFFHDGSNINQAGSA